MNSVMLAAVAGLGQQDEANALIRLRDRLASRGVNAELRDNNSALMVHRPEPGLPVWVFVGYGGAYYSWQNAERRHPVDDVEGAADVLAECVAK
ncbi:hypothetical protein FHU36_006873 [Nonomuraea muscovyensis]|uniref:Uncharacterized protein n=1 Tax=Nonomuraea muscovyensis TaxID=1124761 RepID=A0A7X0F2H8_9ACTN|nr:hypothetical protein [Nonomuraea muscovyensis]MBB6350301.1 hypothetical protein [Nonomuraea muscovyensis]